MGRGGGGGCPEPTDPPLDPPLPCMNARLNHGAFAGFPKQNDKCQTNARGRMGTLGID